MYSFFRGKVYDITEQSVILDVANIGYEIIMPQDDILRLKECFGQEVEIFTYFNHFEAGMMLYGFLEKSRLEFFKKLITVNGVGPKNAIMIIGNVPVEDMVNAILEQDETLLKGISGIGPKTAAKIVFELKDKIKKENISKDTTEKVKTKATQTKDAILALKVLGYSEKEILEVADSIESQVENKSVQEIIKIYLKYLKK